MLGWGAERKVWQHLSHHPHTRQTLRRQALCPRHARRLVCGRSSPAHGRPALKWAVLPVDTEIRGAVLDRSSDRHKRRWSSSHSFSGELCGGDRERRLPKQKSSCSVTSGQMEMDRGDKVPTLDSSHPPHCGALGTVRDTGRCLLAPEQKYQVSHPSQNNYERKRNGRLERWRDG